MSDKKISKTDIVFHAGFTILNVIGYKMWNKPLFLVVAACWFILMMVEMIYLIVRGNK